MSPGLGFLVNFILEFTSFHWRNTPAVLMSGLVVLVVLRFLYRPIDKAMHQE
jgi:Na+/H+ antiporter NhaD/arsenite permease-like protein